jgi:thiol-disulfide isomerase/thioredoxin
MVNVTSQRSRSTHREGLTWVARAFVVGAVGLVLIFGVMTIGQSIREKSPMSRVTQKLERAGWFEVLDFDWEPSWSLSTLDEAPWTADVSGAVPVSRVDSSKDLLVINFWATWCPPCVAELRDMFAMAREYRGKSVHFIFISHDDDWEAPRALFRQIVGGMPQHVVLLRDPDAEAGEEQSDTTMMKRLGATKIPETFFVQNGVVLSKVIGAIQWNHPDIRHYLDLLTASSRSTP